MCYHRNRSKFAMDDALQAMGGLCIVAAIVVTAIVFTDTIFDSPSLEAQRIINAGRHLAGR